MPATFPLTRDDEFYVLLKSSLPPGYRIEAEPHTAYYSEWLFSYNLYHHDRLVRNFSGDFRAISGGYLMQEAKLLLEAIDGGRQPC